MALKVFLDSDVVISSPISSTGAAFLLLNQIDNLIFYISNISKQELEEVVERMNLKQEKLVNLIDKRFKKVEMDESNEIIKTTFANYILDKDDAHIVAGAKSANVQFLITYNTRHYKIEKIKADFNIIVTTPANFLQYLRSI